MWGSLHLLGVTTLFSRVAMAQGPESAARWPGTGQSAQPTLAVIHQQSHMLLGSWLLSAPQLDAPWALFLLPSFPLCQSVTLRSEMHPAPEAFGA